MFTATEEASFKVLHTDKLASMKKDCVGFAVVQVTKKLPSPCEQNETKQQTFFTVDILAFHSKDSSGVLVFHLREIISSPFSKKICCGYFTNVSDLL